PLIQKPGTDAASATAVRGAQNGGQKDVSPEQKEAPKEEAVPASVPAPVQPNSKPKITIIPPEEKPKPTYEPDVAVLLQKAHAVSSYRYTFDAAKSDTYDYFVNGNKVKKVYLEPVKIRDLIYYNEVYLDLNLKTAVGVCTKGVSSCTTAWKKAYPLSFEKEEVILTPLETIIDVPYSAHVVGEELFDGQETSIVEYINTQGRMVRLWMDQYTGLPLKQVIYSVDADTEKELVKHTFTRVILGVKKSEVTFPETEFEMQKE
ncbi:MAG: hypothetical protein HZA83_02605, partial [Thaumarchaeota archaeon]|nr:hypothetical protein [Nitrososphaerota archaeon]